MAASTSIGTLQESGTVRFSGEVNKLADGNHIHWQGSGELRLGQKRQEALECLLRALCELISSPIRNTLQSCIASPSSNLGAAVSSLWLEVLWRSQDRFPAQRATRAPGLVIIIIMITIIPNRAERCIYGAPDRDAFVVHQNENSVRR